MIWALHGAVGMAADWKELSRSLAQDGLTVRSVDLWRYLDCCPMPLWDFAKAFNEEVRAVDSAPVLLGYSLGGRLALHALLDDQQLWQRAVIVSAHTGLTDGDEKLQRLGRDAEWAAKALTSDWKQFLAEWNSQSVLAGEPLPGRSQLEVRRQAVARSFMDWSLGQQDDLLPKMSQITCPIDWVVGGRDEKFSNLGEMVTREVPSIDLYEISGAGHRVPWDCPKDFASLVRGKLGVSE